MSHISIDCKNQKCRAIYHVKIKTFKPHKVKASCPFCGRTIKKIIGVNDG